MTLDEKVLSALRIINRLLDEDGHKFVLIGATVPQLLLTERGGSGSRPTQDIDVTVEVTGWPDFEQIVKRLREAGFETSQTPHRLTFAAEVRLDLLPYGSNITHDNQLMWDDTEQAMSTVGFLEAFQNAVPVEVAQGLSVLVATVPSVVLLKIAAYTDRPSERARDLVDIVYCFTHYAMEKDRRFECAGQLVDGSTLTYEESGAWVLGKDVAHTAEPESLARVKEFVGRFESEYSEPIAQILREEKRFEDPERRMFLLRLFKVFRHAVTH